MGIDYVLARECGPRSVLGSSGIIELGKARERADMVLSQCRDEGDTRDPRDITFQVVLRTPEGDSEQIVRVQDLLDQAAQLEQLRPQCRGCPVDRGGLGYGCTRYIPYPIPAAAEHWLMARLPEDLDTTAGRLLVQALEDFDFDGRPVMRMRDDEATFFESDEGFEVSWGEGDDALRITSDQILHMMFHAGPIQPPHAAMLCLFFGLLPHDLDVEVLADRARLNHALAAARLHPTPAPEVATMAAFVESLASVFVHDVTVLIDG